MKRKVFAAILGAAAAASSVGAVKDAGDHSFALESGVLVEATPDAAYQALVRVSAWWDSAHSWSGESKNLTLDARAGGCFCEKLADDGFVEHARVLFAQPGKLLRMEGALGPLQEMAVKGVLTFTLAREDARTRVTMTYRVAGQFSMAPAQLAPIVDQVLTSQLERFRASVKP